MAHGNFRAEANTTTYEGKMKTAVLEITKKSPRPATPFPAVSGKPVPGWLSCPPLWPSPPSFPSRARCQRDVLDSEREEAERIVAEYREAEKLSADNDIALRQHQLDDAAPPMVNSSEFGHIIGGGNPMKQLTIEQRLALQKEIRECNHEAFLAAEANLCELRQVALDMAKVILQRLTESFDAELSERALRVEADLTEDLIPLRNGADYELWRRSDVIARHSWRELARNAARNLNHENSVGCIQWLCTSETETPTVPWV
jgi:hypothetical protein